MKSKTDVLVRKLNSLRDGELAARELAELGQVAIGPVRRFLLEGKPVVSFQPRQWAVQALASLGAKAALIEYLRQRREILDPATRLAEEAVEISAARALKAWLTEDVVGLMLELAGVRLQVGLIETLGEARRLEAVPFFIRALEDDVCRSAAEVALYKLGIHAKPALLEAAARRAPSAQNESESSLRRRRSALGVVATMLLPRRCWGELRPYLEENDPGIVMAAARIAAKIANREGKAFTVQRLLEASSSADLFLRRDIEDCLRRLLKAPGAR
jgi:hypothetical protein